MDLYGFTYMVLGFTYMDVLPIWTYMVLQGDLIQIGMYLEILFK